MIDYKILRELLNLADNEYFKKYIELIKSNKNTQQIRFITQKHHIIPKYYYRRNDLDIDNSPDNIINLTYTDHILAHCYLAMASIEPKDRYSNFIAVDKLCGEKYLKSKNITIRNLINSIDNSNADILNAYENRKIYMSELQKCRWKQLPLEVKKYKIERFNTTKGKVIMTNNMVEIRVNPCDIEIYEKQGFKKGRKISGVEKMRKSRKGQRAPNKGKKMSLTAKKKRSITFEKRKAEGKYINSFKRSEKCKEKISLANRDNVYVYKDDQIRRVKKFELDKFLEDGWIKGNPKAKTNMNKVVINDGINIYKVSKEEAKTLLESNPQLKRGSLKVWVNNGTENKLILQQEIDVYINDGWIRGLIKRKQK